MEFPCPALISVADTGLNLEISATVFGKFVLKINSREMIIITAITEHVTKCFLIIFLFSMYKFNGEYCRKDTAYDALCQTLTKNRVVYHFVFGFKIVLQCTLNIDF